MKQNTIYQLTKLKLYDSRRLLFVYSNHMNDIYESIKEQNLDKERKTLIVFDDIIAEMFSNKKYNPIVTEVN